MRSGTMEHSAGQKQASGLPELILAPGVSFQQRPNFDGASQSPLPFLYSTPSGGEHGHNFESVGIDDHHQAIFGEEIKIAAILWNELDHIGRQPIEPEVPRHSDP